MSEIIQTEESVKLYEYEIYKPALEDVLAHHQIMGAHWGVHNGPPYPLSRAISNGKALIKKHKKKAAIRKAKKTRKHKKAEEVRKEKLQKTKDQIISTNDITSMLKNVKDYSNDEINSVLKRLDVEENLRKKVSELRESKKTKKVRKKTAAGKLLDLTAENAKAGLKNRYSELTKRVAGNALEKYSKKALKTFLDPGLVEELYRKDKKK